MPDQVNAPGAAGQGNEEAAAGTGDNGFDFERGYTELRPQYTRTTQELASTRERLSEFESLFEALHDPDPAVQAAAFDALGLEAADTGQPQRNDDEFVDPLEQEVEDLRAWRAEQEQRQELEAAERHQEEILVARDDFIAKAITELEKRPVVDGGRGGDKFTDQEETILGNLAITLETADGVPDVEQAYAMLYGSDENSFTEIQRRRYIGTKTGAHAAPAGRTVTTTAKKDTPQQRVAYVDQRWRELEDQQ